MMKKETLTHIIPTKKKKINSLNVEEADLEIKQYKEKYKNEI